MIKFLEANGWVLVRTRGSHRHYNHWSRRGLVTVAGKPSATLTPDTQSSILKQAGLGKGQR